MSNPLAVATGQENEKLSVLLKADVYANRFKQVLGDRAPQFMSSLIAIGNSMPTVEPRSIIGSAMQAACMDLPIDKNLGFAWIIPYRDGKTGKELAQFQMGYRGLIQLGQRSAQYARMNATGINREVFLGYDEVGEPKLDWDQYDPDKETWGYFFGFKLINGFTKYAVWSKEKVKAHAQRYSQAFRSGKDKAWTSNFDGMALKTVVANTLRKWGPLSVQIQQAFQYDNAVFRDMDAAPEIIEQEPESAAEKPVAEHPEIARQRAAQEAQLQKAQAPAKESSQKKAETKQAPAQKEKLVITQAPPPPDDWAKVAQEAAERTAHANIQSTQSQAHDAPVIETTANPITPAEEEKELADAGLAPEQPQAEPEPENVFPMKQAEPEPTPEPEPPDKEQAAPEPQPDEEQPAAAAPEPSLSPAQALLKNGIEEAGFTFEDMVKALAGKIGGIPKKNDPRTPKSFAGLEDKTADWLSKNVKGVVGAIKSDKAKK